jgi:signal transduction histidine kinase
VVPGTSLTPRRERQVLARVSGLLVLLASVAALSQWASWGPGGGPSTPESGPDDALAVFLATLLPGWAAVAAVVALRPTSRGWGVRSAVVVGVAALTSWLRLAVLVVSGHHAPATGFLLIEYGFAIVTTTGALVGGLWYLDARERVAAQERLRAAQEVRAARALADLEREELRVRRQVSGQLHGAVQQRLVMIGAQLDDLADQIGTPAAAAGSVDAAARLHALAGEVDELREEEVRRISHALFPAGADIGAFQAAQVMLQRLPGNIRAEVTTGPGGGVLADPVDSTMPVQDRLVVVAVIEEAVTNAVRHGGARRVHVHGESGPGATVGSVVAEVTVDDDGSGPPQDVVLNGRWAGRGWCCGCRWVRGRTSADAPHGRPRGATGRAGDLGQ